MWEYKIEYVPAYSNKQQEAAQESKALNRFNNYGREGWELVAAVEISSEGNTEGIKYIFKRPVFSSSHSSSNATNNTKAGRKRNNTDSQH